MRRARCEGRQNVDDDGAHIAKTLYDFYLEWEQNKEEDRVANERDTQRPEGSIGTTTRRWYRVANKRDTQRPEGSIGTTTRRW